MQRGERTILYVDDDESHRAGASKTLASLGCRIATAGDADTALALIHDDVSIAALLVCIMLTEAKRLVIAAKGERPDLRVVYITTLPEMMLLDREAPGDGPLLRLPIDPEQARAVLAGIVDGRANPPA
jgi:DNA-binding NtrC family response regulator